MFAAARGYHRREDKPVLVGAFRPTEPPSTSGATPATCSWPTPARWSGLALPSTRAQTTAPGEAHRHAGRRRADSSVYGCTTAPPRWRQSRSSRRGSTEFSTSTSRHPDQVTICEREPRRTFPAAAVRADGDQSRRKAAGIDRRGAANVASALPALASASSTLLRRTAHPQWRAAAAYRTPHGHRGRVARSGFVVRRGARPPGTGKTTAAKIIARMVNDHQWRVGSSRNHTPWWRTCSAT